MSIIKSVPKIKFPLYLLPLILFLSNIISNNRLRKIDASECDPNNGYYILFINDDYICTKNKPSNFYLNNEIGAYELCYETCATCNSSGNLVNNNCLTCAKNFILEPDTTIPTNCVDECPYYYYYDIFDQYICTTDEQCPLESNYLIREKQKCVNSCSNTDGYIFQYNGECVKKCPEGTETNNENICKDKNLNVCTLSEATLKSANFEDDNIRSLTKIYAKEFNYTSNHVSIYKSSYFTIVIYKNNLCIEELNLEVAKIDITDCYTKTKKLLGFTNEELITVLYEYKKNANNAVTVFKFFHPETGQKIDTSSVCDDETLTMEENVLSLINSSDAENLFAGQNINIFNLSDAFYNDICFHFDSPTKKDATLKDRIKIYYPNITVCDDGCSTSGVNLTTMRAICKCQFDSITSKNIFDSDFVNNNIVLSGLKEELLATLYDLNIEVLKCFKDTFVLKYFKKNTGGFIILAIIIIQTTCVVFYYLRDLIRTKRFLYTFSEQYVKYLTKKHEKDLEKTSKSDKKDKKDKNNEKDKIDKKDKKDKNDEKDKIDKKDKNDKKDKKDKRDKRDKNESASPPQKKRKTLISIPDVQDNKKNDITVYDLKYLESKRISVQMNNKKKLITEKNDNDDNINNDVDKENNINNNEEDQKDTKLNIEPIYIKIDKNQKKKKRRSNLFKKYRNDYMRFETPKNLNERKNSMNLFNQNNSIQLRKYNVENTNISDKSESFKSKNKKHEKSKKKSNKNPSIFIRISRHKKIDLNEYLEDDEDMEFEDIIVNDDRHFCEYFVEKIKSDQVIVNSIFIHDNIKPKSLKILLLVLNLDLYFLINGLFFSDSYISERFNSEEEDTFFSFVTRSIRRFLYCGIVGSIINYLIVFFVVEEEKFKKLVKREKNNSENLIFGMKSITDEIKTRSTVLIIISYVISLFTWYYLSCFNNVYPNIKHEWVKSSIFIIIIMQLVPILLGFLETSFRYISFKCNSEKIYKLSQFISSD